MKQRKPLLFKFSGAGYCVSVMKQVTQMMPLVKLGHCFEVPDNMVQKSLELIQGRNLERLGGTGCRSSSQMLDFYNAMNQAWWKIILSTQKTRMLIKDSHWRPGSGGFSWEQELHCSCIPSHGYYWEICLFCLWPEILWKTKVKGDNLIWQEKFQSSSLLRL